VCAEINSPFYRAPRASTWTKWAAAVPEGFEFSVKAPKAITHEAQLVGADEALKAFLADASLLGEKLGPILFQLPPKLVFAEGTAASFLRLLRCEYKGPVALEPRHASWFTADVAALLSAHQVARVAADPARVPEAAEPGGWEGLTYYRLHGSPRVYYSAYGDAYLDELAAAALRAPGEVWVVFDNTASGAALHNALDLNERLEERMER
jgi:uncharacterized protein YecE (DUF72 family)